jgi:tetratricopeptide (TPR) repeat protein
MITSSSEFTLCLIVKDEEQYLDDCLRSLVDEASAMVIVDTGSSDGTVEIARQYTSQILFAPFDGDFSRARNVALGRVRTPWVVFLDADERFERNQAAKLHRELAAVPAEVMALRLLRYNFFVNGGWYSGKEVKIFRNHPHIRYRWAINESVRDSVEELGGKISELPLMLNHFGHCRPRSVREAKALRYMALITARLKADPDQPVLLGYLGLILRTLGRFTEALDHARRAVALAPEVPRVHQFHGHVLRSVGADQQARDAYARAVELDAADAAHWNMLGVMDLTLGRESDAGYAFLNALRADPIAVHVLVNQGLCEQAAGRYGRAVELFDEVARINPGFLQEEWRGRVECDPFRELYYETIMQYAGLGYHLAYCRDIAGRAGVSAASAAGVGGKQAG